MIPLPHRTFFLIFIFILVFQFGSNDDLKQKLYNTYPKVLVEASPYDPVWGIGVSKDDPCAWNKNTWLGKNLLGQALTEVRNRMMKDEGTLAETEM